MKKLSYTCALISIISLFIISVTFFSGCSGSDSGSGGSGPADLTAPITITGPDGSTLKTPTGGHEGQSSISLGRIASDPIMAPPGETLVSDISEISTSSDYAYWGDGIYTLSVPVDITRVTDPSKLQLNISLRSGTVLPVFGIYDYDTGMFVAHLSGIVNGWRVAVTENPSFEIIRVSPPASKGWLTDLYWETYEWMIVNHSTMSVDEIKEKIIPTLWSASETLAESGFRSPRIYVDPRLDPPARVVHIISGTGDGSKGSHFNSGSLTYSNGKLTYSDEVTGFSTEFLSDDELTALGKMYINYDQYERLNALFEISLGNIVIHELFHAVQYGYDIRKSGEIKTYSRSNGTTFKKFIGSLKAYLEGTATPVGQTFQVTGKLY